MAKLVGLVILLIALMAVATSASTRRESSCEMEMEEMMPMKQCMMWMQAKMRNPRHREQGTLEECCSELKEFSSPCRCEAVKEMMMDMQSYGEMEKMEKTACSLPIMCGMSQECHSCSRRVSA